MNLWRQDFPIFQSDKSIYLDNAAMAQVPDQVIDAIQKHYYSNHANVHRGAYTLSRRATDIMENARSSILAWMCPDEKSRKEHEVVFTSGTTESINTIACGLRKYLHPGDEVLVSSLEHHSNFVPWQQICMETGAAFRVVPASEMSSGFEGNQFSRMISEKTKVIAVTHVSNLTGEILPVRDIYKQAKKYGGLVVVDGAQGIREYDTTLISEYCDFYCFSGHKIFGPTGIGVLYGRTEALKHLVPGKFGGGMVKTVDWQTTSFTDLPQCLEAGTLNIAGITGLNEAIRYLKTKDILKIRAYEKKLMNLLITGMSQIEHVHILGRDRAGKGCCNPAGSDSKYSHLLSFFVEEIDSFDLACLLDSYGVAIRQGQHCAQPGLQAFGVETVIRVSPAFYNTEEEIVQFLSYLKNAIAFFKRWKR